MRFQKYVQDSTRVPVELLEHQVCNSENEVLYYYAFITDITESERMKTTAETPRQPGGDGEGRTNEIIAANEALQPDPGAQKSGRNPAGTI